jgi:hypothetical protein
VKKTSNSGEHVAGVVYSGYPGAVAVMSAFDSLPPPVRRAISSADFNFDTREIAATLRHGRSAKRLAVDIELANLDYRQKAYAARGFPAEGRKPDRASATVRRPAGAPAAREAKK